MSSNQGKPMASEFALDIEYSTIDVQTGFHISNYPAACSAGAVFGTLTFLSRAITGSIVCIRYADNGKVKTVFGTYELIEPEPLILSEQEYQHTKAAGERAVTKFMGNGQRSIKFMEKVRVARLNVAARLVCCVPGIKGRKGKSEELRAKASTPSGMSEMAEEMPDIAELPNLVWNDRSSV
jgi:hypothetical protein